MARQKRRTVVLEVSHCRATVVIELSEMAADRTDGLRDALLGRAKARHRAADSDQDGQGRLGAPPSAAHRSSLTEPPVVRSDLAEPTREKPSPRAKGRPVLDAER